MSTPNFTYKMITDPNDPLIGEIYQLGVDNPPPAAWACTPYPHPLLSDVIGVVESDERGLVAIFADGELRMGAAYRNDGFLGFTVFKRYNTTSDTPDPRGAAMAEFQYDTIRSITGQNVKSADGEPARQQYYVDKGIDLLPPETTPTPLPES